MFRNPYGLTFREEELLGGGKTVTLTDMSDVHEFTNNKDTGKVIGVYYVGFCEDGVFLRVKILGGALLDKESLKANRPKVRFIGLTGKCYVNANNRLALSCTADGLEVI